ncbi:uncharacterized protein LOC129596377 isoform X2 [Paramacrobiotus metropolitanus]|uniref:uncharacterized protein LOC129596377 isoform X2 n=1 Tax=Paramacrobiotus metropolitanus TaxID=2943436 RepID=UPI002445FCC1|nr:uncharacterized protein LOC129596377 isoform X2 [Paramacrobiotus metropolitanus]
MPHSLKDFADENFTTGVCDWKNALRLNMSDDTLESGYIMLLYLVAFPVLLFCCTIGSIFTVAAILNDPSQRKTSTAVYMIAAAIGNLCILWPLLPEYCLLLEAAIFYGFPYDADKATYPWAVSQSFGFAEFLGSTALQFVDCTMRPLKVFSRTRSSAWKCAVIKEAIILILAAAFSLNYLWTFYYWWTSPTYNGNEGEMLLAVPSLKTWSILQANAETIMLISKRLLLLLINGVLIFVLRRHQKSTRRTLSYRASSRTENANHIVLGSLVLYLVTQLPFVGYEFAQIASRPPYCTLVLTEAENIGARDIVQIISWVDYSATFCVYYASSSKFRQQCTNLYRRTLKSSCRFCCSRISEGGDGGSSVGTIILGTVTSNSSTE